MATQTQIRRGTSAQCDGLTAAAGEVLCDTTHKRLRVGDGATAGGIILPNRIDVQNNTFRYKAAGGSANTITVTLDYAPAAYVAGQIVWFLATASNTGAVSINVNGLGAKAVYYNNGGTLAVMTGGEIVGGCPHGVIYTGSAFVLINPAPVGTAAVGGWDLLATAAASASSVIDFTGLTAGYINYAFVLSGLLLSSGSAPLLMRISQGGSFKASSGDYAYILDGKVASGSDVVDRSGISTAIGLSDNLTADACHHGGIVHLAAVAGKYPTVCGQMTKTPASGGSNLQAFNFSGSLLDATSQVDGVRFLPLSGTITSGELFCYGLRSSV